MSSRPKRIDLALLALQRAVSPDDVWKGSVQLMRAAMPVYNVLIGLPSLGITPMFMRATLPIPNVERFAQLAPLNDAIRQTPGAPVARMSDHFDPTSTNGRAFLKEFLKPMGWRYGAALLFWDSKGQFTGQLAAIRTGKQGDFTDSEMDYLRELHPQMESVILRLFALENAFAAHLSLEHSLGALPLPIMVVGWDERLNYCNKAATEAISTWTNHGSASARALKPSRVVPPQIQSACRTIKQRWEQAVLSDDFTQVEER